jgi:predicted enzyme related to lactoylglutathione lyase
MLHASPINWFEIPVQDISRAMKFYAQVFRHIRFEQRVFNGISHAIFRPSSEQHQFSMTGALVEDKDLTLVHQGTVLYFSISEGMSSVLERVVLCGGNVVQGKRLIRNEMEDGRYLIPKTLIDGNVGYYAHFTDTEGNRIGIYSNS